MYQIVLQSGKCTSPQPLLGGLKYLFAKRGTADNYKDQDPVMKEIVWNPQTPWEKRVSSPN